MGENIIPPKSNAAVPDVVALLSDLPESGLLRGQVGTVVERLDDSTVLVEFSDDRGRAYAVVPCNTSQLLVLHYATEAA
jgi:uncharacterized protein DUF4926